MKLIRARLRDDVDHATGILSVLSAVVLGLDAEFLHASGNGKGRVDVGVLIHIVTAIEPVTDRLFREPLVESGTAPGNVLV